MSVIVVDPRTREHLECRVVKIAPLSSPLLSRASLLASAIALSTACATSADLSQDSIGAGAVDSGGVGGSAAGTAGDATGGGGDGSGGSGGLSGGSAGAGGAGAGGSSGGSAGAGGTGAGGTGAGGSGGTDVPDNCKIEDDFSDCSLWAPSGTKSSWQCGAPTSGPGADHTGTGSLWATDLSGNPNSCESSALTSPIIDLSPFAGQNVVLRFWQWHHFRECNVFGSESYSGGIVEINSGSGWVEVAPAGGYGGEKISCSGGNSSCDPCYVENRSGFNAYVSDRQWVHTELNVSAHTTSNVRIRFQFGSHQSYGCTGNSEAGWYLDDLALVSTDCTAL